ncbi:MAG: phosphoglycerate kinase, partial [Flavobacteriales bacterium]|nr:phosphoglycerate kinase [Flavobacteriales bacterium]
TAKQHNVEIHLPVDSLNAQQFSNESNVERSAVDQIPDGWMGLDIGSASVQLFSDIIIDSQTIIWNGPMGVFEMSNFEMGTREIANAIAEATAAGAFSLIGGGDSVAAINQFNLANQVSYVSTGGGAMLEYLEGKVLPGVHAILN